ncbi:hypothetical protein PMZ80_004972 [Knufia obscura]|uniref:Pentatricopeptide repeat domain-containing protein n=2 Tax=Knufia TaxID=430999 RepID=A0AAN8IBU0_9EURO|nr:hypothetical protein PMZ80_004972 [Knufia obscura]KAK5957635.1 hypothetical protein OHC33_000823 [Knufia fluminis]
MREWAQQTTLTPNGLATHDDVRSSKSDTKHNEESRKNKDFSTDGLRKYSYEFDRKKIHYLQDVDAERHFVRLKLLLQDESKSGPSPDVTRCTLSGKRVRHLSGSRSTNMWVHRDGSGCAVTVYPKYDVQTCDVALEGTARARELTLQHLQPASGYAIPPKDLDWLRLIRIPDPYRDVRDLPHPPHWDVRSFKRYVDVLTAPHKYRSAMRYVYQGSEHRHQVVGDLLEWVFSDTSTAPFASTAALRSALRYCRQHTELANSARHIWQSALSFGLQPDISCFNSELSRCLVVKDNDRYTNLLLDLRSRGITPDSTTFALILRYATAPGLRRRIIDLIQEQELAERQRINASITSAVIKQEVALYMRGPDGLACLDERMKDAFGPNWLTTRNVERLLRACRIRKSNTTWASDVLAIVHKAYESKISLDLDCMTELFRIAKKAGNLQDAVEILKSTPMQGIQHLSQELIESFFLLAWQKKHFNLCRLVWIYAATLGCITMDMQQLVQRSLQSNVRSHANAEDRTWLLLAGKIIIDGNLGTLQSSKILPRLSQRPVKSSVVGWLLDWTEESSGARHEQMQLSQLLLEKDLHAWRFYESIPYTDFLCLVDMALALDDKWKMADTAATISPIDLLSQSFDIPLQQRAEPIVIRSTDTGNTERREHFVVNEHKLSYDTFTPVVGTSEVDRLQDETDHTEETSAMYRPTFDTTVDTVQLNELAAIADQYESQETVAYV